MEREVVRRWAKEWMKKGKEWSKSSEHEMRKEEKLEEEERGEAGFILRVPYGVVPLVTQPSFSYIVLFLLFFFSSYHSSKVFSQDSPPGPRIPLTLFFSFLYSRHSLNQCEYTQHTAQ